MDFTDLSRLAGGHVEARIIQTAVELEVFDSIGPEQREATSVAADLDTDPRATELLLNALTAIGLLRKSANRFALEPVAARYLVRNSSEYLGGMIVFDAALWSSWERLSDAIRTGKPTRPADMYQNNTGETEVFINAMDSLVKARGDAERVASAFDWNQVADMLDIGSGPATYPIYLCRRFPGLRVTVFDLPGTVKLTERYIRNAGMATRIKLVAGDYRRDPVPGRYQVIFLSNVIHGEGFQENRRLVQRLSAHLTPGGRILIKDHILEQSRTSPPVGAVFSLLMLLTTAWGRCYSFDEIKDWLEESGLEQVQKTALPPPLTSALVVGVKPLAS